MNGKVVLDNVNDKYEEFKSDVSRHYDAIMGNWQVGTGRNNAENAFSEFMANSNKYKEVLEDVSNSITDALKNYQM